MSIGRLPPVSDPSFGGRVQIALDQMDGGKQSRGQPVAQPEYLVATLPDATRFRSCSCTVSDAPGGYTMAFSDGTNWRNAATLAIIA